MRERQEINGKSARFWHAWHFKLFSPNKSQKLYSTMKIPYLSRSPMHPTLTTILFQWVDDRSDDLTRWVAQVILARDLGVLLHLKVLGLIFFANNSQGNLTLTRKRVKLL